MSEIAQAKVLRLILAAILAYWGIMYLYSCVFFPVTQLNDDLLCYYLAAVAVRRGLNLYDVEVLRGLTAPGMPVPPYLYPPVLAILLVPFTFLDYPVVKLLWIGLNHVVLVSSIVVALKAFDRRWSWSELAMIGFLTLSFDPIRLNFLWGQVNILTFLLLVVAFYFFKRGKEGLAGASLALATAIKISPALFILYFLWKRKWRLVGWAFASLLVLAGSSVVMVSRESLLTFTKYTLPSLFGGTLYGLASPANQSLGAFFKRLFTANPYTQPLITSEGLATIFTIGLSLGIVAATAAICRDSGITKDKDTFDLEYSLVTVVSLAVAMIAWDNHFVWLLLPFIVLSNHLLHSNRDLPVPLLITAVSYALIATNYDYEWGYFGHGLLILFMSPKLYGLMLLWGLLMYLHRAHGRWTDESPERKDGHP